MEIQIIDCGCDASCCFGIKVVALVLALAGVLPK
jgi:hypothetical protein